MALPPKFRGHRLVCTGDDASSLAPSKEPLHTVEMYLDFVCPFSAKMMSTFERSLAPKLRDTPSVGSKVQFIFRQQIQPWHPASTLTHEAAMAVQKLAPEKFWEFAAALFALQANFFDVNVVNETRNETYKRLAEIAADSIELAEKDVLDMLLVPDKPAADGSLNVGNRVTNDLKVAVKMARLVGVHVSPTVITDGVVANEISSSWTGDQWMEYLTKLVAT